MHGRDGGRVKGVFRRVVSQSGEGLEGRVEEVGGKRERRSEGRAEQRRKQYHLSHSILNDLVFCLERTHVSRSEGNFLFNVNKHSPYYRRFENASRTNQRDRKPKNPVHLAFDIALYSTDSTVYSTA